MEMMYKVKRKLRWLPCLFLLPLVMACNNYRGLRAELQSSYKYDGQEIVAEGYFSLPRYSRMSVRQGKIGLAFKASRWEFFSLHDIFNMVDVSFGKEPNSIYMPEKFTDSQVEIYDKQGNRLGLDDKIRIRATVEYLSKTPTPQGQNYAYTLKNVVIEKP